MWPVPIPLQLKEQLSRIEQTHNSELEGMKKEISQLTQELHQRDIAVASASGSTSDMEQRLRMEIERAERKAVEHRVKLLQGSLSVRNEGGTENFLNWTRGTPRNLPLI